ncbi:uncharacterized protein LOC135481769 [Liolophura sinensis]|uniref:uncharacterized protein LOC135481769 n=1 Tax=Liolophura sinensis TaxID=3198878 RepID=UPI003158EF56
MAVYTVGISCCLCILTVILVEEVRAEGLRSLRLVEFDARIFQTAVPSVRRVVIVEEHHEVLKYWYEAAQDGIIPEEGLTLLRFDSHSGVSPLAHMDKTFPLFHWPTRLEELHHMIQESDDFVMAAALTKLFKRYVWVWPSWNAKNYASISGYEAYVVHIGWTNRFSAEDKREYREICGCLMNDKRNECRMRDYRNPKNSSFGLSITQEECNVVHRGILEVVRDDVAQEKLETEIDWLKPDEPLLLDIDADFYGSSSPEVELREVGVTKQFVHNISLVVGRIVCARSAQQETAADRLFGNLINTAQRYRHCMFRACPDSMNFVQLTQTALTLVTDMESESDYYGMFCTHNKRKLQALLEILLKLLLQLTSQQLHRLRWVGFCLQTSTKSFDYKPYDIFRVCTGKTGRHDYPSVTYHAPSKGEVINQTALLQDILYDGVIAPKFVTISRSVREGFAPRKHISLIESHVLATVFQVVNKNNSAVHYDKELFWGVHGWELRDKLVNTAGPIWNNVVL